MFSTACLAQQEGVLGWTAYVPSSTPDAQRYFGDPWTACSVTARRHVNTDLVKMTPSGVTQNAFDCWYVILAGGGARAYSNSALACLPGYSLQGARCAKTPELPVESCETTVGNPIEFTTGDKVETALDYEIPGPRPFEIARTYRSSYADLSKRPLGQGWRLDLISTLTFQSGGSVLFND